jgi:aminopeptidase N
VQEAPEQWPTLRSHRVADRLLRPRRRQAAPHVREELDVVGAKTEVPALVGRRSPTSCSSTTTT